MQSGFGNAIVTILMITILGKSFGERLNPQYVCSAPYRPVFRNGCNYAIAQILTDGLNRLDEPVHWSPDPADPMIQQLCVKQWAGAGCSISMNCQFSASVSYNDILRVARAVLQCTDRGQGGIGLLLPEGDRLDGLFSWWITISSFGPSPAPNIQTLLSTMLLLRQGSPRHGVPPMVTSSDSEGTTNAMPPVFSHWANEVAYYLGNAQSSVGLPPANDIAPEASNGDIDWLDCAIRIVDEEMDAGDAVPECVMQ